jgi:hypothetical protein
MMSSCSLSFPIQGEEGLNDEFLFRRIEKRGVGHPGALLCHRTQVSIAKASNDSCLSCEGSWCKSRMIWLLAVLT